MSITRFPSGLAVGAALMYFLDPVRGRKRRARLGELATHARRVERDLVGKGVRDAEHRARGARERFKRSLTDEVADGVLQGRVRAALGRVCSHPRALDVEADAGTVYLRGAILERETAEVLRCAREVAGVRAVVDRLERHVTGNVAALAGAGRVTRRGSRQVWPPAFQLGAIGGGSLLAVYGLLWRRGLFGTAIGAAGGALLARGAINRPFAQLFGRGEIAVQKTITVDAPIERVFDLWSRVDSFPRFMNHVREVEVFGRQSRWVVDGPAGTALEYRCEMTRLEPDRVIEWKTVPGETIEHCGRVQFEQTDNGTRVQVEMTYRPPAGMFGHAVAHMLGFDPKTRMDDDLIRMKGLLEQGHTRAHGVRIDMTDLH